MKTMVKPRLSSSVISPSRVVDPLPRVIMRPNWDSKMLTRKFCERGGEEMPGRGRGRDKPQ